ncbi:hypothetical protein BD779DRAFT_1669789 [Infundibulicybe gibba]|nr:hypothetical protein BD779DRAFT_1669789 [Infundibulicybe gibba]
MRHSISLWLLLSGFHLSQAIQVYLSPQRVFPRPSLPPDDATSAISRHLGLEIFEPFTDATNLPAAEEIFVGKGSTNAMLLTMDEQDASMVLPSSIHPSFSLAIHPTISVESLTSVITTFLHRAQHSYSSVYSSDNLLPSADSITLLSDFLDLPVDSAFVAVELGNLSELRQTHGPSSHEYAQAAEAIRILLKRAFDASAKINVAVITFSSPPTVSKRSPDPQQSPLPPNHPPPQEPIGAVSTCFASADACTNATNSCSGRGECLEASKSGKTCFVCACRATKTGEGVKVRTEIWVGESCERKDISSTFALFTGTALVMAVLVFGSIYLLSSIGDQTLPSTLTGTLVGAKKE